MDVKGCNHTRDSDGGTLKFIAHYGAPGIGQSWKCTLCDESFSIVGDSISPASEGRHIPEPDFWR